MKQFLFILFTFTLWTSTQAQVLNPVKWSFDIEKVKDNTYDLKFKAKIEKGWTVYSQNNSGDGPVPTTITFEEMSGIELIGKAKESGSKKEGLDPYFDMEVVKFLDDKPFIITQRIKVLNASKPVSGYVEYMACDKEKCLPPTDEEFTFRIPIDGAAPVEQPGAKVEENTTIKVDEDTTKNLESTENQDTVLASAEVENNFIGAIINGDKIDQKIEVLKESYNNPASDCGGTTAKKEGWFWTFLMGMGWGLIALLTPCVFPMLPITVSFFTKDTKRKGWVNGLIYAASIIVIYVLIGLLITIFVGPEALNRLSTNWIANTLFFLIFVAFAFSFFGYYELTLPSSWSTGSDRMADKGGLLGIFFMAFTLALVSFSCTGPLIGTAIVQAATKGEYFGPFLVMLGFAFGLALPFGLFAAFPAWLNSLPRSGSWMNSVKVVLGFLELALALKFLSVADMTNGWGILRYELFMVLWIVIFIAMAAYLFGFIKFPHDSPIKKLSKTRMAFGALSLLLVVYLASGFRINKSTGEYNALGLMSGLAPPTNYNFFNPSQPLDAQDTSIKEKYPSYSKCANNINCFKDYFEGMNYAKEVGKPVMLDFTGHGCVNCRKTEEHIWVDDRVRRLLNDSLVLISLYVDEDKKLSPVYISANSGKKLRNIGNKWADFQIVNFEQNSQPLYVIATSDQQVISRPRGFVEGIEGYLQYLECNLAAVRNLKK